MSDEQTTADGGLEIEEQQNAYRVQLPSFEGPLDLLLHLIKKHELDILDIPIGFISKKYVEYIKTMELLSIDLASEYLVMAATLAHIKSRSLLPPDPSQAAEDDLLAEEEDPRAELIRRLLEYQKYKNAAENLSGRAVLGRDVFTRGAPNDETIGPAPLAQLSLFKLVDAFEAVLTRAKRVEDHQIDFERISISERIGQISELLRQRGQQRFEQLFDGDATRADMIVTFLALLEMTKLRMTSLRQDGPLEPIYVELSMTYEEEDEDALSGASASKDQSWVSEFDEDETDDDLLLDATDESLLDGDATDEAQEDEAQEDGGADLDRDLLSEHENEWLLGSDENDSDIDSTVPEGQALEASPLELAEPALEAGALASEPEHALRPLPELSTVAQSGIEDSARENRSEVSAGTASAEGAPMPVNEPSDVGDHRDPSPQLEDEPVVDEAGASSAVLLGAMASYVASALDQNGADAPVTPAGPEEPSVEEPLTGIHLGPEEKEIFANPGASAPAQQDDSTPADESVPESNPVTTSDSE